MLLSIIAKLTKLKPRKLVGVFGDVHLYENHMDAAHTQLSRGCYSPPTLKLPPMKNLCDLREMTAKDFKLVNYTHHSPISAKLSVGA